MGSCGEIDAAAAATASCAGDMKCVWKAPATVSLRVRAFSGGSASSARRSPPRDRPRRSVRRRLRLAGTSSSSARRASTCSSSPPRTAAMVVGSSAQAFAISRPRTAARLTASSRVMTPAMAAAASSPTEWPATTRSSGSAERLAEFVVRQQGGHDDERLGHRGVGDLLRGGGGPRRARSSPVDLDHVAT